MNITTTIDSLYALGLVENEGANTTYVKITADCFKQNTAKNTVAFLLYTELLQSGAGPYSRAEFQAACDALGTKIDTSVTNGIVTISLASLGNKTAPSLALLESLFEKPQFKLTELKRAARTLKNILEQSRENAKGIAHTLLKNTLVTTESRLYGYSPDQLLSQVDTVTIADIKSIHQELMLSYWTVSIGGTKQAISTTLRLLKKIKKASVSETARNTAPTTRTNRTVVLHEVSSKQNIELSIGDSLPLTLSDKNTPAFMFGLAVLAKWGGFAGRLMSTVREKEGLTYGIYGKVESLTTLETGNWRIMTFFSPKDVVKGITSTLREISLIASKGITDNELIRFKTILKTSETLMFDSLSGTVGVVHSNLAAGLTWDEYTSFRQSLQKLTKKEVNAALKTYLRSETLCISAAGPVSLVRKDLEKFMKS